MKLRIFILAVHCVAVALLVWCDVLLGFLVVEQPGDIVKMNTLTSVLYPFNLLHWVCLSCIALDCILFWKLRRGWNALWFKLYFAADGVMVASLIFDYWALRRL